MTDYNKYSLMKLEDDNYYIWSQRTELWLKKEGTWDTIAKPRPDKPDPVWIEKDEQARSTIGLLIADKFLADIKHDDSAKKAWTTLRDTHSQNTIGARMLMYRKIFTCKYTPGTNMSDHITGILATASRLEDAGYRLLDEVTCSAILGSLPPEYDNLVTNIEGRTASDITIPYVREKVMEAYRKKQRGHTSTPTDTKALFTHSKTRQRNTKRQISCYYCHKVGHVRRDCRILKNQGAHQDYTRNTTDKKPEQSKMVAYVKKEVEGQQAEHIQLENTHDTSVYRALNTNMEQTTRNKDTWIIDTGAADHMCSNPHKLHNMVKLSKTLKVATASGEVHNVTHKGDHILHLTDNHTRPHKLMLTGVLYVPSLTDDLLAISRLDEEDYEVIFKQNECWISKDGKQMKLGIRTDRLYTHTTLSPPMSDAAHICSHIWHRRLAHRNQWDITKMARENIVNDLEITACQDTGLCTPCTMAKMTNAPFAKAIPTRSRRVFQMIHSDLCGPILPCSIGRNSYILTLTDDFSRYSTIYLLKSKDQTTHMIQDYIEKGINRFARRPEVFFSDGGGEFHNSELAQYFSKKGIRQLSSLPYTPEENGKAERLNRTLLEATRTLLKQAKLPNYLWGEIASTANYLLNLVIHKDIKFSPHEIWFQSKPSVKHLRTIGTRCFFLNTAPHKRKLEDRGIPGILIGYGASDTFYRIWNIENNTIYQSRRVIFEEEKCPHKQTEPVYLPRSKAECPNQTHTPENQDPHPPTEKVLRRSTRNNLGQAPAILSYDDMGTPTPCRKDWYEEMERSHKEDPHPE